MAEAETKGTEGNPKTTVKLEPGEKVSLCRCFASKEFPYCDGRHRQHEGKGPVIVEAAEK